MAIIIMSWLGDAFTSISKSVFSFTETAGEWFSSSDPEKPTRLTQDTARITTTSFARPTNPIEYQNTINPTIPDTISNPEQKSMQEVASILKDCGISGMPKHIGNLDVSLPDSAYSISATGNMYNSGLNPNYLVALHNHLDSPANQAAFNLGVQANIKNPESLEKFLLRHAENVVKAVSPDTNLHYYIAQLAVDLVNHSNKDPAKLFKQDLKDCLLNYHLTTKVADGIKFEAHVGATATPVRNNVGSGVFAKAEISF